MGSVGAPWLVFVMAATWRQLRQNPGSLPKPSTYVGSAVVYSLLALAAQSERARQPVALFAWSLVVAQVLTGKLLEPGPTGYQIPLNSPAAVKQIGKNTAKAKKNTQAGHAGTGLGAGNKTQRGKAT